MVITPPTRHGSPSTHRRRMRLSPPRSAGAGWTLRLAVTLSGLLLCAMPALAAPKATTTPADTENLAIPEGSATPTGLSGGSGGTLLRLGLGLVVVIGLIAAVWFVMKRVQRARYPALDERGPSLIDVVATTSLGPSRSLHLVRVGDEIVLVGATDHSVNVVARIGAEDAPGLTDLAPTGPGFGRPASAVRAPVMDDRQRAAATDFASLVERLRSMTTRR